MPLPITDDNFADMESIKVIMSHAYIVYLHACTHIHARTQTHAHMQTHTYTNTHRGTHTFDWLAIYVLL